jgi:hypothetical protein
LHIFWYTVKYNLGQENWLRINRSVFYAPLEVLDVANLAWDGHPLFETVTNPKNQVDDGSPFD